MFVKEVQQAVLDGRADLAVHSAKDLPSASTPGLLIGALTARRDPRDALIGCRFNDLPDERDRRHRLGAAPGAARRPPVRSPLRRAAGQHPHAPGQGAGGRRHRDGHGRARGARDRGRVGRNHPRRPDARRRDGAAGRPGGRGGGVPGGRRRGTRDVAGGHRRSGHPAGGGVRAGVPRRARVRLLACRSAPTRCSLDGGGLQLRTFLAGPGGTYEGVHEGAAEEAGQLGGRCRASSLVGPSRPDGSRGSPDGRAAGRAGAWSSPAPAEQVGRLRELLIAEGAEVIEVPTIAVGRPSRQR